MKENSNKNLSVIIPVYNEEGSIKETVNGVQSNLKGLGLDYEIIVVNDCSTDKSREILEKIEGIKLINHFSNRGYGASLKTGIKNSKFDWILIIDGDGSYPVSAIPELIKYIPEYDMVIAARKSYKPALGKPAKWFLNKFASYLSENKVLDLNSGLRIFNKKLALDFWNLLPEKFSFTSTLTMAALTNNYGVFNIKIDYLKRVGKSKLKPFKSFKNFSGLIVRLSLYFKPLKVFTPISILLFLLGAIIFFYSWLFTPRVLDTTTALFVISSVQVLILGMLADLINKKKG